MFRGKKPDHNVWRSTKNADGTITSHYTVTDVENIIKYGIKPSSRVPVFDTGLLGPLHIKKVVWDSWIVSDIHGVIAKILGKYRVVVALVQEKDETDNERMAYLYTKDNVHYKFGGYMFQEKLFSDCREWSGSTRLLPNGMLQSIYTVSMPKLTNGNWQTLQRFAVAVQPVEEKDGRLVLGAPVYHALLFEADGDIYETPTQASLLEARHPTLHSGPLGSDQTENNCFRDPFHFVDKYSGREFILFEANTGERSGYAAGGFRQGYLGENYVGGDEFIPNTDSIKANGCVGVAEITHKGNKDYFAKIQLPLLTANLVTDEIERIHYIRMMNKDGTPYYLLFVATHGTKMAAVDEYPEDLTNLDILLGFRSETLFGELTPLNGNGIVVCQKSSGPAYQGVENNRVSTYSYMAYLESEEDRYTGNLLVGSYANWCKHPETGEIIRQMTGGPSFDVRVDGHNTDIVGLRYDMLPLMDEEYHNQV